MPTLRMSRPCSESVQHKAPVGVSLDNVLQGPYGVSMDENTPESSRVRPRNQWVKEAACNRLPPDESSEIFFVKAGRPAKKQPYMNFCDNCPVKRECLSYALVHDAYGIWGGMSRTQRQEVPRQIVKSLKNQARAEGWLEKFSLGDEDQSEPTRRRIPKVAQNSQSAVLEFPIDLPDFSIELVG